jgi:hypothetical protein
MATFDQDALDLQREQAEAAAAAAKDEDASGEEGGAPAVPGADPSAHLARFLLNVSSPRIFRAPPIAAPHPHTLPMLPQAPAARLEDMAAQEAALLVVVREEISADEAALASIAQQLKASLGLKHLPAHETILSWRDDKDKMGKPSLRDLVWSYADTSAHFDKKELIAKEKEASLVWLKNYAKRVAGKNILRDALTTAERERLRTKPGVVSAEETRARKLFGLPAKVVSVGSSGGGGGGGASSSAYAKRKLDVEEVEEDEEEEASKKPASAAASAPASKKPETRLTATGKPDKRYKA